MGYHSVGISWFGAKDAFLKPFMVKVIFLSRQARDKYRESTQKERLFVQISLLQVASATSLRGVDPPPPFSLPLFGLKRLFCQDSGQAQRKTAGFFPQGESDEADRWSQCLRRDGHLRLSGDAHAAARSPGPSCSQGMYVQGAPRPAAGRGSHALGYLISQTGAKWIRLSTRYLDIVV